MNYTFVPSLWTPSLGSEDFLRISKILKFHFYI